MAYVHRAQIYYEDTDHSGLVYHANYFKYFERAREHMLGVDELVRLYNEEGIGFVVYKAEVTFKDGARFGETVEVRSTVRADSDYRAIFQQEVWRPGGTQPAVIAELHLVCVDANNKLVRLPPAVRATME